MLEAVVSTTLGEVLVRPARVEDAVAMRALRLEALAGHPEAFGSGLASAVATPPEAWSKRVSDYARDELGTLQLAEAGGRLVGMTGLVRGNSPKNCHSATIISVYVTPEWRGLHLAEALIAACLEWGRGHGVTIAKLAVVTSNEAALRCYTRLGFSPYGIEPQALLVEGVSYDEVLMAKVL